MKRHLPLILLTLLALLVSSCEVFPYASQSEAGPTEVVNEPSATNEPTSPPPTATLIPSATPTSTAAPEETVETAPDIIESPTYTLQEGSPVTLPNFNHPEAGCSWLGVAGQVFDEKEQEVLGLTVLVGDAENPEADPLEGITGEALAYGLGGFEIQVADETHESSDRFWIQVLDPQGAVLTARHSFETSADCENNLVLINFVPLEKNTAKNAPTPTPTTPAYP